MKKTILFLIAFSFISFSQQNFWEQTNGPNCEPIKSLVINSNNIVFVGNNDGIFESDNNGDNWSRIGDFPVSSLVITSENKIYAGGKNGIYKSNDYGSNWQQLFTGPVTIMVGDSAGNVFAAILSGGIIANYGGDTFGQILEKDTVTSMAIAPNGELFVGVLYNENDRILAGLLHSSSNGWDFLTYGGMATISAIAINSDGDIFTAYNYEDGSHKLYRIQNNTNNLTEIDNGLPNTFDISAIVFSENQIFIGINSTYDLVPMGIFRSSDNGDNWVGVYNDLKLLFLSISSLAVNSNGNIFAGIIGGVLRSTNNGNDWTKIYMNINPRNTIESSLKSSCLIIENEGDIFCGNDCGLFRSNDNGGQWHLVLGVPTFSLALNANGDILAGGGRGIFLSSNSGETWSNISHSNIICLAVDSSGNIFAGVLYEGLLRSTNNGSTWTQIIGDTMEVSSVVIKSDGYIFAGTFDKGIIYSTDKGDNWSAINNGLNYKGWYTRSMVINSFGYIFIANEVGIFRSTDNGENWVLENNGLNNKLVGPLLADSNGEIFAGIFNYYPHEVKEGIYRSVDNGEHWSPINSGLTARFVNSLAVNYQGYIFAGTDSGGVFKSTNPTAVPVELLSLTSNIINKSVQLKWSTATEKNNKGFEIQRKSSDVSEKDLVWNSISFVDGNGTTTKKKTYSFIDKSVSSGTYLYRLKQIDFDGTFTYSKEIEINFSAPLTFSLSQNYPNPFNPTTTIKYTLPEDSNVKLTLINSLGEKVMDLVNGKVDSGNHDVKLNGSNLASGIYFYRLQTEKYTSVKKLILLK